VGAGGDKAAAMIPRIYLYAGLAIAIGLGYWRYNYVVHARDKAEAALVTANATLAGERIARATEQADRRKADESAKSLEAELARINSAPKPVSVYCRPAHLPSASEGGAAAGVDVAAVRSGAEEPLRDIGIALSDVWREQQSNAARQRALIEWERSRSH